MKLKDLSDAKDFELELQKRFKNLKEQDKNYLVGCLSINEDMSIEALELLSEFLRFQIFSMKFKG